MTYQISTTAETFASLEDALAAAIQAGAVYDDNAIEALEQGRKDTATLFTKDGGEITIAARA